MEVSLENTETIKNEPINAKIYIYIIYSMGIIMSFLKSTNRKPTRSKPDKTKKNHSIEGFKMVDEDFMYEKTPEQLHVTIDKGHLNCDETIHNLQENLKDQLALNATIPKLHAEIDTQSEKIKTLEKEKNDIKEEMYECCYKDAIGGKSRKHRKYKKRTYKRKSRL